jgi:bifunctional non-homologous end joining protein LigD
MAGLDLYRAKRNFGITAEPRGRVARAKAKTGRFVIQRHDATRLHYDLRLELDGVYKSWAVTKTPSLDPAVKRLAVEVEDHPLDYGTFEGTIPQGQYGGGTVQLWGRGNWAPQSDSDPLRDLAKGHLKFEMRGERMHGGWALIRLRDEAARPGRKVRHNWLLIKERDDEAKPEDSDALQREITSVKTGRTLEQIAGAKHGKVWHSNRAEKKPAGETSKTKSAKSKSAKKKTPAKPRKVKTAKKRTAKTRR